MPKLKTHKATVKRFKITKGKKFLKRSAGQGHFNARESSRTTMNKRRDKTISETNVRKLRTLMPYFKTTK